MDSRAVCRHGAASEIVVLLSPFAPAPSPRPLAPLDWRQVSQFCSFHGVRPALVRALETPIGFLEAPTWMMASLTDFMQGHVFSVLQKTGEIVGVHILGNEAPELIAEYVLAMNMEGSVDEVHRSIHAHPTLSEALMEAAAATTGEAIHI